MKNILTIIALISLSLNAQSDVFMVADEDSLSNIKAAMTPESISKVEQSFDENEAIGLERYVYLDANDFINSELYWNTYNEWNGKVGIDGDYDKIFNNRNHLSNHKDELQKIKLFKSIIVSHIDKYDFKSMLEAKQGMAIEVSSIDNIVSFYVLDGEEKKTAISYISDKDIPDVLGVFEKEYFYYQLENPLNFDNPDIRKISIENLKTEEETFTLSDLQFKKDEFAEVSGYILP